MTVPTPIAYWNLNEASGTRADAVGSSSLTAVNSPTGPAGLISNAAHFIAASSQSLTRADDATIGGGDIDWTFNFWIKWHIAPSGFPIPLSKDAAAANGDYVLFWDDPQAKLKWEVLGGTGRAACGNLYAPSSTGTVGTWYMITVDHSATTNTVGFRVNGGARSSAATTGPAGRSTQPFVISSRAGAGFINADIDEFGFWKRSLTDAEALELYASGAGLAYPFPLPPHTTYTLGPSGGTVVDLTDATKHVVLAQGVNPKPTRQRTLVSVSGRDAVQLATSQATAMELSVLLGVTGATHDALIANWNEIRAQLRLAREWALTGVGSPIEFTYAWASASAPVVYDVIDGDFPPPPTLTNPVVSAGQPQYFDAVLSLVCQPYGRAAAPSVPTSGALTNDTTGWTLATPVAGDEPAPARIRVQNPDATPKGFLRLATRSRGNPANFLFPIIPGASAPSGFTTTLVGGGDVSAVSVTLRARSISGTAATVEAGFVSGGTFYPVGAGFSFGSTSWATSTIAAVSTDPRTSVAWKVADINAYEWGVRKTGATQVDITQVYVSVQWYDRDMALQTTILQPTANGSIVNWTTTGLAEGSEWDAVNDPVGTPDDATTFIASFTNLQVSVYTTQDVAAAGRNVQFGASAAQEQFRVVIATNLADQYGAYRVMARVQATAADPIQLKWGGPNGNLIANEAVAAAGVGTAEIVDLGRMNIPEQDVPPDVTVAYFVFSLWRGAVATGALTLDAIELWPAENYLEIESTSLIATNQYAVIDSLGRTPTAFLADSGGYRIQTLPHVGSPPILRVGATRVLARLSRSRTDDRRADTLALDARYYTRYELQRGAG